MKPRIVIIGAGFSGLSAACVLAGEGFDVHVLEKNDMPGGRARRFESEGFTFDMGPSWYWMPDVFEHFFALFGKKPSDYYRLVRLDPSYSVFWGQDDFTDLPAGFSQYLEMVESMEKGGAEKMKRFLDAAEYKYRVGIGDLVFRRSSSILEFVDPKVIAGLFRMDLLRSFHSYIRKYFRNPRLIQMLEFPVLFLGGTPKETPALYSLMNYGDIKLGTWYPMGGMFEVVKAMEQLAVSLGATIHYNSPADRLVMENGRIKGIIAGEIFFEPDIVLGSADYHHVEQTLLPPSYRQYSEKYWSRRTMSPSSMIFFLGFGKKIPLLRHHTLFFDEDFSRHAAEIYQTPKWPERPSIYISNTSKTDPSVAPEGTENVMVLIPVASHLQDSAATRNTYFDYVMGKLERYTGQSLSDSVLFSRSYAHNDFITDYHAFGGNAYGLANTLLQTAFLKPKMKSHKVENLYYAGQLTVPGPGVPPAIISGQVAAREIIKHLKKSNP